MKARFKNISIDKFSLNGIEIFKVFIPQKVSDTHLKIVNVYDGRVQLLDATKFDDISIDGVTYGNVDTLISNLKDVLYAKLKVNTKYEEEFQDLKNTVQSISAGEGGKMYETLAAAQAVDPKPSNGTVFTVSKSDTVNAGYYTFQSTEANGTRFEKPFPLEKEEVLTPGKNLFNPDEIIVDTYINSSTGNLASIAGWAVSGYISIEEGQKYTLSGTRGRHGLSFFSDKSGVAISGSYNGTETLPITVTAPAGSKYVVFALYSSSSPNYYDIQFEKGVTPTAYEPFQFLLKNIFLDNSIDDIPGIKEKLDSALELYDNKNLFNPQNIVEGYYLASSAPEIKGIYENWAVSGYIPVEPGKTYTLSGNRGRHGLAFTNNTDLANYIDGTYNGNTELPITVTAPAGATHIIFNLYQPTNLNYSNIQFEESPTATSYEPYTKYKVKASALPGYQAPEIETGDFEVSLNEATESSNYIKSKVNGKELKQFLRPFQAGYVFGFKDVYYDGTQVKAGGDEAAPYRIDGSTIGANHDPITHVKNREFEFYIDGLKITDYNKIYYPEKDFTVKENYDIEGANTAGIVAKVSISYVFDETGACVIYTDIIGVQNVALNDIMFVMATKLLGTYSAYIPKSLPFTQDTVNYDLSSPYDMTNFAPPNPFYLTPDRCEDTGILCDRTVMLRNDIGFALGYLPLQDAGITRRREVATAKALEIRNDSKKVYMSAIDPAGGSTLNAGDYYSVIAYRSYFVPQANSTSSYIIKANNGNYVYLDWHTTTTDRIKLPVELSGRPFEVVEKSNGVTVLSKENTGSIVVDIVTEGYLILKFINQ